MKRRRFGLLAGTCLASLKVTWATAQTVRNPTLLTTTLTPLGAERAGNAAGTIPVWTGTVPGLPPGSNKGYVPELFPDEQPMVLNASNMSQHADKLSAGVQAMMQKYGYSINVYPTHRTAAAPQYVYDNSAKNVSSAALEPTGGRLGFTGAYGGVPFPIPDISDPLAAGAEILWNHFASWNGYEFLVPTESWAVSSGQLSLAYTALNRWKYPFYDPSGSLATFSGKLIQEWLPYSGPPDLVGQMDLDWEYTEPYKSETQIWELLNGQGRVRRAPELSFDTPSTQADGIANYDEYFGMNGSPERYDIKYVGKQEMYIPYNCNRLFSATGRAAHLTHFLDPTLVRWELHRCWVIELTLHAGERNTLARRRFYIDEDTWQIGVGEAWDAQNNLYKSTILYNYCRPDLPGVVYGNNTVHNLQTDNYVSVAGPWDQKANPGFVFVDNLPLQDFDPLHMAATAQY